MPASTSDKNDGTKKKDAPDAGVLVHDMKPMGLRHLERPPLSVILKLYDLFNTIEQRSPPSPHKTKHLRLITIRVSHYNEKARWALDLMEEDQDSPYYYTEDTHPAGFQALESVRASKGQYSVTPMVVEDDGATVYAKSDVVLRHYCPFLYPTAHKQEIEQLEDDWGDRLGPAIRTYAYGALLQKAQWPNLVQMNTGPECATIENLLFPYMRSAIKPTLEKSLQINDHSVALAEQTIRDVFQEASERLANNNSNKQQNPFLVGNSLTAADLTFAALSSPMIRPPELKAFQAPLEALPVQTQALIHEMQATPAGQHVLHMYRTQRYSNDTNRVVQIKCAGRNRIPWIAVAGVAAVTAVAIKVAM